MNLKGPRVSEAHRLFEIRGEKAWMDLAQSYGKTFLIQGVVATCEPELVEAMLMRRTHTERRPFMYRALARIFPGAPGVLFMDGEEWLHHIHAVMPIFTRANVDSYSAFIHESALAYASRWQDNEQFDDLFTSLTELGAAILLRIGYGVESGSKFADRLSKELIKYKFDTMGPEARVDKLGLSLKMLLDLPGFTMRLWRLRSSVLRLRSIVWEIIQEGQDKEGDRVDCIRRLHDAGFSLPQITNDVNHLYGAFNAIDFCITAAFYELSRHPEWADILRAELSEVLGAREYPTREDFDLLPNTIGFMKEVFRCYPVAMAVARRTGESLEISGRLFPAGTEMMLLVYTLHHHPDFWDAPEQFDPRRWQQPPREEYSYIPFLTGPRQCIGRHLAELNFVIILNALLPRFDLEVLDHTVRINRFLIPRFERAIPFRVRLRRK